ncbi:MAG: hypothetical protein GY749_48975 [Desulfobacteraceae bacterium]|nr:hypothetical protein [Desulfobacteraceae bacterium]
MPENNFEIPLRCTLRGHLNYVTTVTWSPDKLILASGSIDRTIRIWDAEKCKEVRIIEGQPGTILSLAWSPDGKILAMSCENDLIRFLDTEKWRLCQQTEPKQKNFYDLAWSPDSKKLVSGSSDGTVSIWDAVSGKLVRVLDGHRSAVCSVVWSPDGQYIASGSADETVRVWKPEQSRPVNTLKGHRDIVLSVAWASEKNILASGSRDNTIRIWNPLSGRQRTILEGHTHEIQAVSFNRGGQILVSISFDNSIRLWHCDTWTQITSSHQAANPYPLFTDMVFHPELPVLASVGEGIGNINIYDLHADNIPYSDQTHTIHYINAKVVLLGDSSVGKSGLGTRIAENRFRHTEPTHGAQFFHIPVEEVGAFKGAENLQTEISLWDLAGQPEYRLIHQLFLDDIDAALILSDCSDPADPFKGVKFWSKVLRKQAPKDAVKFLVPARCDLCPVSADINSIREAMVEFSLESKHFPTSAKTGDGVEELMKELIRKIPWDSLPCISTPRLFEVIREFILAKKEEAVLVRGNGNGRNLIPVDEIDKKVREKQREIQADISQNDIREKTDTVIRLLQAKGLVFRLDSGEGNALVLLKPEFINQYGASIIQAARNHHQGIGAISGRDVMAANFAITGFIRLEPEEERIVIESTVDLFIQRDLCLREMGYLVFPSQINLSRPESDNKPPPAEISYEFSGNIDTIYATLVVRLSYTGYFQRENQWKYAAEFSRNGGGRLGFSMKPVEEGTGELEIYFYAGIDDSDRVSFIRFITDHLNKKGIDIRENLLLRCSGCGREVENRDAVKERVESGKLDISCQYCDTKIIIPGSINEQYNSDPDYPGKQQKLSETAKRRTKQETVNFRSDIKQRRKERSNNMIYMLHISDIHLGTSSQAATYRTQLETDLRNELKVRQLDYMVISGDIANYSTPEEYKAAFELVDGIARPFRLDPTRIITVSGNHDLNWDISANAYDYVANHQLPDPLTEEYIPAGTAGALKRNDDNYKKRFANFSEHFYKKVYGKTYPADYSKQGILYTQAQDRILFLGLNSCWNIDHNFKDRSGIQPEALSKTLNQILSGDYRDWLKIAVWHHPVAGVQMMQSVGFLEQLATNGFQICMHGHIHETQQGFYSYDSGRGIHIIGAGTFGAPAEDQVTGIPLQYNLLVLDPDTGTITVKTRKKERPDGAWAADSRWGDRNNPRPEYYINLREPNNVPPSYSAISAGNVALSIGQKSELRDALSACATMKNEGSRNAVVNELRNEIQNAITRGDNLDTIIMYIVTACLNYDNGIRELIRILRLFERNSIPMQKVDEIIRRLNLE